MSIKDEIKKVRDNVYEIPGSYDKSMRASGRFYIADEYIDDLEEGAIEQIVNVASVAQHEVYLLKQFYAIIGVRVNKRNSLLRLVEVFAHQLCLCAIEVYPIYRPRVFVVSSIGEVLTTWYNDILVCLNLLLMFVANPNPSFAIFAKDENTTADTLSAVVLMILRLRKISYSCDVKV